MTDMETETTETETGNETETETETSTPEERKFTQKEVDDMISKRLAKETARREREDAKREAERQKQAEIDALEGEAKLKAQYQADLERVQNERAEAQRELRVARAGNMLAKHGLDSDFAEMMAGETDEATQANVDRFAQMVTEQASKLSKASLSKGAPPVPNGGTPKSEKDRLRDEIFGSAGLDTKRS